MKMKHNKKRNTAFLYESLIREYTSSIVKENVKKQNIIKNILKEFFSKDKPLKKELDVYNALLEYRSNNRSECYRMMYEVKKDFFSLDRKKIFNEQTKLIKTINEALSNADNLQAKQRIILEDKTFNLLSSTREEQKEIQHIDNLTFKTFIDKFNETYENSLRQEQKTLLTYYITSFANNGLELKCYINEELGRIKTKVDLNIKQGLFVERFNLILKKIEDFSKTPVNEDMIKEVFYLQDLVHEVSKNDS